MYVVEGERVQYCVAAGGLWEGLRGIDRRLRIRAAWFITLGQEMRGMEFVVNDTLI